MDWLKLQQDSLCSCLSHDPDYILDQCGDILSVNNLKEVQKQRTDAEKIQMLLSIIIKKGEVSCQHFVDILKQHQVHYQQLQQIFNPGTEDSAARTMFADHSSVVTATEMTNTKVKSISFTVETEGYPGSRASGKVAGQVPPAMYTAQNGSVICADKLTGVTVDGDINLSVRTKKSSQAPAEPIDNGFHSPQGPAVITLIKHKVELIEGLRGDLFILQHVHSKSIITDRQYENLKHADLPEQTIINLLDVVIRKGQETCAQFIEVLKEPEIIRTYPQLKRLISSY